MQLPSSAQAFVAAVIGAGAIVLIVALQTLVATAPNASWLVLAGLGLLTGACMIKLPRIETRFSLSDALVFTAVLLVGPGCAAVVAAVDALSASLRFNKRDGLYASRTMFNMTAAALSIWIPGHAFSALGGQLPAAAGGGDLRALALPLAGLVAGYSVLNTGAVAIVLALTARARVGLVWRRNFAWLWIAHAWSGIVAAAIAIYMPHVNAVSLVAMLVVGAVGYATVRVYVGKVEESTGHLHKLNELYLATIKALAMAIDAKDQVTHGHIRRVQVYAVGLARALGVADEPTLKGIEAGALLHDTGKIAVPEHILNKPGKLSAQEYEKMKSHVTIGADILSGIDFPYPVIPYVRHHHENWDGTGYPDGLRGEAIPLGARILSVVDCFDALTSDRPYRRALSTEAALDILRSRSGSMYDSRVVDKFIEVYPQLTATLLADGAADEASAAVEAPLAAVDGSGGFAPDAPEFEADLLDLPRLAASGLPFDELSLIVLHRLARRVPYTTAVVFAPRRLDDRLEAVQVCGSHREVFGRCAIRLSEGLSGWVAAHGLPMVNANPSLDLAGLAGGDAVALRSAVVVPMTAAGGGRAALALYAEGPDAFSPEHARLAGAAAGHLSRAGRMVIRIGAVPAARSEAA